MGKSNVRASEITHLLVNDESKPELSLNTLLTSLLMGVNSFPLPYIAPENYFDNVIKLLEEKLGIKPKQHITTQDIEPSPVPRKPYFIDNLKIKIDEFFDEKNQEDKKSNKLLAEILQNLKLFKTNYIELATSDELLSSGSFSRSYEP